MQIRRAPDGREARIHHDELAAVVARLPDPVRERGETFADVRAAEHDDFRVLEVGIAVGSAIEAERLLVAGTGAHHAEAAVVIEILGLERHAGELADEIALLVRQRHAGQHPEGVVAVFALNAFDLGDNAIHCRVPADIPKTLAFDAFHGFHEAVGMVILQVALDAFRAKPAFVEGKFLPRLEAHHLVVLHQQLDAALHAAETAVGLDHFIRLVAAGKAFGRRKVQRRPETGDQFFNGNG
jgi:hypothetical protein